LISGLTQENGTNQAASKQRTLAVFVVLWGEGGKLVLEQLSVVLGKEG